MLARANRIVTGAEFRTTTRLGTKRAAAACLSYSIRTAQGSPARFGFIVSKSVGNAVVRNRVRRRMRAAAYQLVSAGITGYDVVLRALPAAVDADITQFAASISRAVGDR